MNYSRNLKEQVAETLAMRIFRGVYAAGETLPREVDLTVELDVSRTVLREALGVLAAKGLTETRTRRGTTVRPRFEWNLLDPDMLQWQRNSMSQAAFFGYLIEVRRIVEPGAAALTARRANASQINILEALFRRMEAFETAEQDALTADREFHRSIMEFSGNPMLAAISAPVMQALEASIATTYTRETFGNALPIHGQILDAIRAKDPDAAHRHSLSLIEITAVDLEHALRT